MRILRRIDRDQKGAAVIEMAFALPVLIIMLWMIIQLGLVFRAMSGIQHGLGEGARLATIYPQPDDDTIKARIEQAVYGIGPGSFQIDEPINGLEGGDAFKDLRVTYTQETDLLLIPGPTISVERAKRVWVAAD